MKSVRKLLAYTKPYKLFVILAPLLMALEVAMDLLQPLMMQKMIDNGIANDDMAYVVQMGILTLAAAVIGLAGGAGCTIYSTRAAVNFAADIRRDVFQKIEHFTSENHHVNLHVFASPSCASEVGTLLPVNAAQKHEKMKR